MSMKGHNLSNTIQLLETDRILHLLEDKRVTILPVVDSTNQYLLDRICTLQSGDACIAECQKAGRGRRGRQWISPFGINLYLSMFWRLKRSRLSTVGLSLVVGIVLAEALQCIGAEDVRVKWPNDLYLNDRKLAGILVELIETKRDTTHLVMGAGINLAMYNTNVDFIHQKWINLQEAGISIDRNVLAATLLNNLRKSMKQFEHDGITPFVARWDSLDNFINRPVKLLMGEQQILGIARGIDRNGALLLEHKGVISSFIGGEISLRSAK